MNNKENETGLHRISARLNNQLDRMYELSEAILDKVNDINRKPMNERIGEDKMSPNDVLSEIHDKLDRFDNYNDKLQIILENLSEIV